LTATLDSCGSGIGPPHWNRETMKQTATDRKPGPRAKQRWNLAGAGT